MQAQEMSRTRKPAAWKESEIVKGHLMPDPVHMMMAIPPKYAVSQVVGFIENKSTIYLARVYGKHKRNFVGLRFWAREHLMHARTTASSRPTVDTKKQEQEDVRLDQLGLWR
jgi:putative transposase